MYKLLVTSRSFGKHSKEPIERLEAFGCDIIYLRAGERSLLDQLREQIVDADAVLAGLETYDDNLLRRATKLKLIARNGVGYDAVDLEAAQRYGIKVAITPNANSDSVADMAVALMLACARRITTADAGLRAGAERLLPGVEMWRKTIGVIGTGRIGQGVARRAKGFEMDVLCYDVYPNDAFAAEIGARYTTLDDIYANADFITVHTPLSDETRGMIGARELAMMKPTAVVVNTARGGIIDEDALYDALKAGTIWAAGLDAQVVEPMPKDHPLLTLDNCIATPHLGANTIDAVNRMGMMGAQNIIDVLSGRDCPNLV